MKALLCTRIAFTYTTREPEVNSTWAEPFEKIKLVSNFVVDIESRFFRCLRSLKGESTFGSSMNLAIAR